MKHNKLSLVILGSGTCIPTQDRGMPGLIIKAGTENLLFDGGSGSLHRLEKTGVNFWDLNFLFYTHKHSDHTLDLIALLQAIKVDPFHHRTRPLFIHGPKGFSDFLNALAHIFGKWLILPDEYEVGVKELTHNRIEYPFGTITTAPMKHSKTAIGYRVDIPDGRSITYSGDTDYCDEIIQLATDTDVLVLECSTPDDKKQDGHLTPSLAAKIAAQSNCRHLILTHFYPVFTNVDILKISRQYFNGKVTLAEDLMQIDL